MNLGSLKDSVAMYTVDYYNKALRNCRLLQVNHYGIHAGFYRDIPVERLNKPIKSATLSKTTACLNMFYRRYRDLEKQAKEKNIQLYIENNVLSEDNRCVFYPRVPFMLLHAGDYFAMKEEINAPLLLDIAHLKVTAQSLGLDFVRQLHELWPHAPYIHLSDNDGINDQNLGLSRNSRLYDILKDLPWQGKMVTLEISGDMETVKQSRHIVEELVS